MGRGAEDTRLLGKVGTAARIEGEALTVYYLSYVQDWLWRLYYGQEDLESWVGLMREDHCGLCLERERLSVLTGPPVRTQNPHGKKAFADRIVLRVLHWVASLACQV